jgi:pimeloyl-ACP methyl ester carboxylesterase
LFFGELPPPVAAQTSITGHWEGGIAQSTGELKLAVDIKKDSEGFVGSFDVPAAAVFKFPLNVNYVAPKVQMRLPGVIFFDGEVQADTLSGKINLNNQSFPFRLKRQPIQPALYREEEVRFQNGGVTLAGTLRTPLTKGKHPALFLLQGSGASDRTSEQFYADYLARRGFATLVYDKRGTGNSTGNWEITSFDEFAGDALAGVHYLQSRHEINPKQVGLWGRSHGGMVAPLAASRSKDVAFIINVSGNSLPVTQNIIYGTEANLRNAKFSEADIKEAAAYMRQKYEVARTGQGWEEFQAGIAELQNKKVKWLAFAGVPKSLDDLRYFWKVQFSYDPSLYWQRVKCPVLAVYGEVDGSQPVSQIAVKIEQALKTGGNKNYTVKVFPKADHALLVWSKPEEAAHFPVLADGYLEILTSWLVKRSGLRK